VEATLKVEAGGLTVSEGQVVTPTPVVIPKANGEPIAKAVQAYLDDLRMAKRPHKSIVGKEKDLDLFMAVCTDAPYFPLAVKTMHLPVKP